MFKDLKSLCVFVFQNECRQLYCNQGQVLQNGTCRYILDSDTNRTYAFEMILSVQELHKEMVDVYLKYFCNIFSEYINGSASEHTDGYNIEIAVCKYICIIRHGMFLNNRRTDTMAISSKIEWGVKLPSGSTFKSHKCL